jgi:glycosyltransferase involved in cell wall biosynthesis
MMYEPGYEVYFCHRWFGVDIAPGLLLRLPGMIREADIVHLTSVYSFPTIPTLLVCRLLGKPVVWSPRGALQRWDGATRPRLKRFYDRVCDMLVVRKRSLLHVTSEREASESRIRISNLDVVVIPNGVDIPEMLSNRSWRPGGSLRLLFVGRLHPIKRLEVLLEACGGLLREGRAVTLTIAGEGDAKYRSTLVSLAGKSMPTGSVRWLGPVEGEAKEEAFAGADVLALPSESENFGMVVAEALARGVPVIASRGTPWSELERQRCGFWVESTPEAFAAAIVAASSMDLAEMGIRGRAWMEAEFRWERRAEEMKAVYVALLDGTFRTASREARGGREAR